MHTLIYVLTGITTSGESKCPSPIIGRTANIEAAVKLASSDPEDSDINTILAESMFMIK